MKRLNREGVVLTVGLSAALGLLCTMFLAGALLVGRAGRGCFTCVTDGCNLGPGQYTVRTGTHFKEDCLDMDHDGNWHCCSVEAQQYDIYQNNRGIRTYIGDCQREYCSGGAPIWPRRPCPARKFMVINSLEEGCGG